MAINFSNIGSGSSKNNGNKTVKTKKKIDTKTKIPVIKNNTTKATSSKDSLKNVDTKTLQAILEQKNRYAAAKTDAERAAASAEANRLRSSAGIVAGDSGLASASEINKLIDSRGLPNPKTDRTTVTVTPGEEKISATTYTPPINNTPTETLEDIINRQRREKEVNNALLRQQQIAQGQSQLQGSLGRTRDSINQQRQSLDPRFGSARGAAVAGTRVAQNRLANVSPFSGQQSGRTLRQAQGLEADLQGRQSQLDTLRQEEEQGIALRDQQAVDTFNQGLQSLQAGASAAEIQNNIRAGEQADSALLQQAQNRFNQEQNNFKIQKQEFADTINRFANDFQAEINRVTNDGDPSNDWQIPYLQSARQNKIVGIEQSQQEQAQAEYEALTSFEKQTYERAIEKWKLGIGLNANEAAVLGKTPGAVKVMSSGGGSGYTQNQIFSNAEFKIRNNIPLNAEEAAAMNVNEGYVAPSNGTTVNNNQNLGDNVRYQSIDDISESTKRELERIIMNPNLHGGDPDKLMTILNDLGISPLELDIYEDWRESALNAN